MSNQTSLRRGALSSLVAAFVSAVLLLATTTPSGAATPLAAPASSDVKTRIVQAATAPYSVDSRSAKTQAIALLRPHMPNPSVVAKLLDIAADDTANNYADGARFNNLSAGAVTLGHDKVLIDKLVKDLDNKNLTGAPRTARLDALGLLLMSARLSTEATVDDLQTSLGDMSPGGPGSSGLSGAIPARAQLNVALRKETEAFDALKVGDAKRATSTQLTATSVAFTGLGSLGVTYTGDKDGDGVENLIELPFGSSPLRVDSDGDGLRDDFEILKGLPYHLPSVRDTDKNNKIDADEDIDGDGRSAIQEQTDGTDPLNFDYKAGAPIPAATGPGGIKVSIDTGANDKVTITDLTTTPQLSGAPGQLAPAFDLHLAAGAEQFDHATVEVPYTSEMLSSTNPADLRLMYFDPAIKFWVPATTNQSVDTQNNVVRATIEHFSIYALFDIRNWSASWTGTTSCKPRQGGGTDVVLVDLALVLDSSGSMSWNDPAGFRKTASKSFVDSLLPEDRAAVVDFDSSAQVRQSLTTDKTAVKSAIDQIDDSGGTNIGAGVSKGIDVLGAGPPAERAKIMILLTDGQGFYNSSLTAQAGVAGITIYTIGLGPDVDAALLTSIATGTGGSYHPVATAADLPKVFRTISEETTDTTKDTDGDGVTDCNEIDGVLDWTGKRYTADPRVVDTDGDGLSDGEELGARIERSPFDIFGIDTDDPSIVWHDVKSDPRVANTDSEGYDDGAELIDGTSSRFRDSDFDGLDDFREWELATDPNNRDTDGDGFYDGYEVSHSDEDFNPTVHDKVMSKWLYAGHFSMGAICGTGCERDTVAWLAGNLTVGVGSSSIPVFGWIVGGIADLRDAVFSAIKSEYVAAGFAVAGVLPYVGDAAAATAKITRFVNKYAHRIKELGPLIAKLPLPRSVQIALMKIGVSGAWDSLRAAGISDDVLYEMRRSKFDLNNAASIMSKAKGADFPEFKISGDGKLQHMFTPQPKGTRHSEDFGIDNPNQNNELLTQLSNNIRSHVSDPTTLHIDGTYRGKPSFLHYNVQTSKVVIQTKATGEFDSGWRLRDAQLHNTIARGSLN